MFKKKLFLSFKDTPNPFKLLRVVFLLFLVTIISYGIMFSSGIIAQTNPSNNSFYCLFSFGSRVYDMPCVWMRDVGIQQVPSDNPNKYYPDRKLAETIEFTNNSELDQRVLKATLISECRRLQIPASNYGNIISQIRPFCAVNRSCLSDYYSGIFMHNLDLVKSRYPAGSEIFNYVNAIQQSTMNINCGNSDIAEFRENLRIVNTEILNLSRLTELNPGTNPSQPSRPVTPPSTIPPVTTNPMFCWYETPNSTYNLPCVYFTSLDLTPTPMPNPNIYTGFPDFAKEMRILNNPPESLKRNLGYLTKGYCNYLKTPISAFNSRIAAINNFPVKERYGLIGEYFRNGIYLHTLQVIVSRPQNNEINNLVTTLANDIASFDCSRDTETVLVKLNNWYSQDLGIKNAILRSQNQASPPPAESYSPDTVPETFNPLYCSVRNSSGVVYDVLCDYVRRYGIASVASNNQIYLGNQRLGKIYRDIIAKNENLNEVRETCRYLRTEIRDFDSVYFATGSNSANLAVLSSSPNFFHNLNLVSLSIENINPADYAIKNRFLAPGYGGISMEYDGDTSLFDTSIEIMKRKKIDQIKRMNRDELIAEYVSKIKLGLPSQISTEDLRKSIIENYTNLHNEIKINSNEVFDRPQTLTVEKQVRDLIALLRDTDCTGSSNENITNEMQRIYKLDQDISNTHKQVYLNLTRKIDDAIEKFGQ